MQRNLWQIVDYFHQFIFGFIYHDIERCIEAKANYVVALALLSYTEYIGGLISGNLGIQGKSEANFKEALEHFPHEYKKVDSSIVIQYIGENGQPIKDKKENPKQDKGIYSVFRCGMVHEYFIKNFAIVYNNPDGHVENHIGVKLAEYPIEFPKETSLPAYCNKVLEFYTNEYFRDFRLVVDKIYKMLIIDKNQELLKKFNKSLDRAYLRKIL